MLYCIRCLIFKEDSEFTNTKSNKAIQSWCNACKREYKKDTKSLTADKRQQQRESARRRTEYNTQKIIDYLLEHPCACGETNPIKLEFDHLLNKRFNVSEMIHSKTWEQISEEIIMTEVKCANCHKIKTAAERNTIKHQWMKENE